MNSGVGAQLPQYQCHKKVWALKIISVELIARVEPEGCGSAGCQSAILTVGQGFEPIPVDESYVRKHNPVAGGYYVVYDDGYKSFSPAKAFEEGYVLVPPGMAAPKPCCLRFHSEQVAAAFA